MPWSSKEKAQAYAKSPKGREVDRRGSAKYRTKVGNKARALSTRAAELKRRYGLTLDKYAAMLTKQSGVCCLCGNPPKRYSLFVDHDHLTGRIRGLLCSPCNATLGRVENKVWMAKVQQYLWTR